jgi:hypothetical protein
VFLIGGRRLDQIKGRPPTAAVPRHGLVPPRTAGGCCDILYARLVHGRFRVNSAWLKGPKSVDVAKKEYAVDHGLEPHFGISTYCSNPTRDHIDLNSSTRLSPNPSPLALCLCPQPRGLPLRALSRRGPASRMRNPSQQSLATEDSTSTLRSLYIMLAGV